MFDCVLKLKNAGVLFDLLLAELLLCRRFWGILYLGRFQNLRI
jgi:hypothetical protein